MFLKISPALGKTVISASLDHMYWVMKPSDLPFKRENGSGHFYTIMFEQLSRKCTKLLKNVTNIPGKKSLFLSLLIFRVSCWACIMSFVLYSQQRLVDNTNFIHYFGLISNKWKWDNLFVWEQSGKCTKCTKFWAVMVIFSILHLQFPN
jgi:hypothetical protein